MDGILAMDPAGPIFEKNKELKLGKDNAKVIQVLHTDTDKLGYRDQSYQSSGFFGAQVFGTLFFRLRF